MIPVTVDAAAYADIVRVRDKAVEYGHEMKAEAERWQEIQFDLKLCLEFLREQVKCALQELGVPSASTPAPVVEAVPHLERGLEGL